jgi:rRNA processing protein Gar1
MKCFGASANPEFGPVEEIAIMIKIKDIDEDKKKRYIYSFDKKVIKAEKRRLKEERRKQKAESRNRKKESHDEVIR